MKFGEDLDIDIKDYLGRVGPGVTIILSILYKEKIYEAMYWYTEEYHLLQFPEEIEKDFGNKIEEHEEYDNIMSHLLTVQADYLETAKKLDDIFEPTPETDPTPDDPNQEEE
tara:strand:- start:6719 stop:7054 length:336 start_codon:yes stop_codon:yes gene_type:complete